MTKFKLYWLVLTIWLVHSDGIKVNLCELRRQNEPDCTTKVYIPNGGLKGLLVGPEFVVEGFWKFFYM